MSENERIISDDKILKIDIKTNKDISCVLAYITQVFNISDIATSIQAKSEYVVQIPAKLQAQFENGDLFLNKNTKTGIEWPSLMKKADNGQTQFVANLPIKEQRFIQGNPVQDICESMNNIFIQKKMAQMEAKLTETYEAVIRIEKGQQDDRISEIETGKKQIMFAMSLKDDTNKMETLRQGLNNLLLGAQKVGKVLQRRVDEFEPLPANIVKRLLKNSFNRDYLNKKDDEVEYIQDCYYTYIEAMKIVAAVYTYQGEIETATAVFNDSKSFIESIDFTNVKTISYAHKKHDFSDWFFNNAIDHIQYEEKENLESQNKYDYYQLEVTGEELLEGLRDGE